MDYAWPFAIVLGTFLLSTELTRRLLDPHSRFHVLDYPNERSLHRSPVPRSGGVAILGALLLGGGASTLAVAWPWQVGWIALGALGVGLLSYGDDRVGLAPGYRLVAHLLAGVWLVAGAMVVERFEVPGTVWEIPTALGWALSILAVAWLINLYNFMDGMDGLAGVMALIGFSALGVLGLQGGDPPYALACLLIAAASAGFLVWNAPPARVFMGDVGSSSLGYLVAAMALWGAQRGLFPLWGALLIFSPFLVDATWTLLRRLVRGERVWEAHRSHHYQRLVQAGWGHRKTLLWATVLMLACAATGVRGVRLSPQDQWFLLGAWVAIYGAIGWKVALLERSVAER